MELSISNIGWDAVRDKEIYGLMREYGYTGLEIAPTRIFPDAPYGRLDEADRWSEDLKRKYGFRISSMQSIWYGRTERLFGTEEERALLMDYTKQAIEFASRIGCKNLVFGCPKNRRVRGNEDTAVAVDFFREAGEYALEKGTVIGLEANPPIYGTNYVNDTWSACRLIQEVGSRGFLLNLDMGTMVENQESISMLEGRTGSINHVHVSEPFLKPVIKRKIHADLLELLRERGYMGYISIEMGRADTEELKKAMEYLVSLC